MPNKSTQKALAEKAAKNKAEILVMLQNLNYIQPSRTLQEKWSIPEALIVEARKRVKRL